MDKENKFSTRGEYIAEEILDWEWAGWKNFEDTENAKGLLQQKQTFEVKNQIDLRIQGTEQGKKA